MTGTMTTTAVARGGQKHEHGDNDDGGVMMMTTAPPSATVSHRSQGGQGDRQADNDPTTAATLADSGFSFFFSLSISILKPPPPLTG